MSEGKCELSEKRGTRATEEGLVSRPMPPSCFIRAKSAKNSTCSWEENQLGRVMRYNVSLGNTVYFESKKDYHVVVLRQLCVRNEVYS